MRKVTYQNKFTNITFYSDGTFEGTIHNKQIEVGKDKKGYLVIPIRLFHGRIHRIIWQLFHPEHKLLPSEDIHHINGIKTDNSLSNLRLINHIEHSILTQAETKEQKLSERWFNNGKTEIRLLPGDDTPDGYLPGRIKGSHWYNNGEIAKHFNSDEEAISQGYIYRGRILGQNKIKQNGRT